jgi:RNA polymerase sigma-70 factor, ECF subfamily
MKYPAAVGHEILGSTVSRALPMDSPLPIEGELTVALVYRLHASDVTRWAARLGAPDIDVEDVVQEVFAVVSRKLRHFRGDAKLETWLFRITDKIIRNLRRRAAVRRILVGWSDELAESTPTYAPSPFDTLATRRRVARAYEVLDRLPEKYRRVIILFELEQLPCEDIARFLGATPSTVRVWLFRAREKFLAIQRKLEEMEMEMEMEMEKKAGWR